MKLLNRNKILSSVILLFSIILIFLIIDMTSISTKYVNKSIITFEINNVRNPQLKKLVRFFDNVYSQLFFYLSKNQKKNFSIKTELHQQFPDEILVEGIRRVKIQDFKDNEKYIICDYSPYKDVFENDEDLYPLAVTAVRRLEKLTSINKKISSDTINAIKEIKDPSKIFPGQVLKLYL